MPRRRIASADRSAPRSSARARRRADPPRAGRSSARPGRVPPGGCGAHRGAARVGQTAYAAPSRPVAPRRSRAADARSTASSGIRPTGPGCRIAAEDRLRDSGNSEASGCAV